MSDKISIEDLPVTQEFRRQRRLIQERGELALIEDGTCFRHLGYFSLKKSKTFFRGGHYHLVKVEHFYVVSGRLLVRLVDLDSGHESEVELREGQRVTIHPRCAHLFRAEEDAQVIEYYEGIYDPDDDVPFTAWTA